MGLGASADWTDRHGLENYFKGPHLFPPQIRQVYAFNQQDLCEQSGYQDQDKTSRDVGDMCRTLHLFVCVKGSASPDQRPQTTSITDNFSNSFVI